MNQKPSKISIIVTTYNWPYALRAVLKALFEQKTTIAFEIIVADDGSASETSDAIERMKKLTEIPILHVWQEDQGFRAATIRNKAILKASGDYIIFLDGDCIPRLNFVERHFALAEPGFFVVGNRVLLNKQFTLTALSYALPLNQWSFGNWCWARLKGHCNRILPFISLPFKRFRKKNAFNWRGAKGCNLAVWKCDLHLVNGWEERFTGWGFEDSDLVIRLLRAKIKRKEGRFYCPVIHLWHPENDRSHERENWARLESSRQNAHIQAELGLNQYQF